MQDLVRSMRNNGLRNEVHLVPPPTSAGPLTLLTGLASLTLARRPGLTPSGGPTTTKSTTTVIKDI